MLHSTVYRTVPHDNYLVQNNYLVNSAKVKKLAYIIPLQCYSVENRGVLRGLNQPLSQGHSPTYWHGKCSQKKAAL